MDEFSVDAGVGAGAEGQAGDVGGGFEASAAGGQPVAPPPWLDRVESDFASQLQAYDLDAFGRQDYDDDYGDGVDTGLQPQFLQQPPAQASADQLRAYINEAVQQGLAPMHEQAREQQWDALMTEYPDLQDPEAAAPVAEMIEELAERAGNPDLVDDPRFARSVVQMMRSGDAGDDQGDGGLDGYGEWAGRGARPGEARAKPGPGGIPPPERPRSDARRTPLKLRLYPTASGAAGGHP
jgi:hypothetical protein